MLLSSVSVLVSKCRSGTRRCRASNKDWLRGRVLGIFFNSDEVLMVACQDGLLYMVDARSGAVSSPRSVKVYTLQSPSSCTCLRAPALP